MNTHTYYLVLEYRHGDFMPIDINLLSKSNLSFNDLKTIDNFTKKYFKEDLYQLIKENNLVSDEYLKGNLLIINEKKYRFPILTQDDNFAIDNYIVKNIKDKVIMNKLVNIYQKYCQNNLSLLKEAINKQNAKGIINILLDLDYETLRNIYVYLASIKY